MLIEIIACLAGLGLLIWSADRFVDGASAVSYHLGMSPMMIGLTIVAFGTSAPEMFVSAFAAFDGAPELAFGNAIGSNIANVALVLGTTLLIVSIKVAPTFVRKELIFFLLTYLLAGLLLADLHFGKQDALIMLIALVVITFFSLKQPASDNASEVAELTQEDDIPKMSTQTAWGWLAVGLVLLLASSKALVWGATGIASALGVSELIIGLTVIAIGTSLPELAASVGAALKGETGMALGNIVGSNILNLLMVLSVAGLIQSATLEPVILHRDYLAMMLSGLLLIIACRFAMRSGKPLGKGLGILLLTGYVGYNVMLGLAVVG